MLAVPFLETKVDENLSYAKNYAHNVSKPTGIYEI